MHLPRRLCSMVGIFCVALCCLFYVADYYDYYYSRTAAAINKQQHQQQEEHVEEPRILPVSYNEVQDNDTANPANWRDSWKDSGRDERTFQTGGRFARDKTKRSKYKKKNIKSSLPTQPEVLQVYEEEYQPATVDENYSLENSTFMDGAPIWSEFADRGYTIVGTNGSAMRRLPQVLIIGVKKAGTRALLAFLRVHPSIRAAGPEIHFFDRFYYRGLAWYRSQMPPSLEGQLTVEKTPAYFTTPEVPARVKADLPGVRLLLVVRDPVTRAISDYAQGLSKHGFRKSFEELAFVNATTGLVNSNWGPINGGLYAKHLKRWYEYFPRSNIHFVNGENLVHDPAAELAKVQEFLGLRRVITDKHFFFNATKGFPCLVKRERSGRPHCLGSSKGRSHPSVSTATSERLRDFYRPFNFKFYKMVGQKFHW